VTLRALAARVRKYYPPLEALIKLSLITAYLTRWRYRLVFVRLLPGPESSSGTFYSLRPP